MYIETIIFATLFFMFGITVGSFLNVCIYRIPKQENIVTESSHCMNCGKILKWYELIPLFSFLIQGGKCRNCHTKLSWQYPAIEFCNGLFWTLLYLRHDVSIDTFLFCICTSILLVLSIIDWRTFEIPFACNVGIALLGLCKMISDLAHWENYVIGFFVVSGFFYFLYLVTKGRAMGGGDIKLMAAAGLLLGWKQIILAMIIGCILGAVIHSIRMKVAKEDRVLAFGPYLSMGIFFTMLYGNQFIDWYLSQLF